MFRTKICGVTTVEDALAAATAGADCIGLNFYRGSPRYVDPAQAARIVEAVRGRAQVAGVFVAADASTILQLAGDLRLDLVQLSGDDEATWIRQLAARLPGIPILAAVRVGAGGLDPVRAHLQACRPNFVLWDAVDAGQYGGTGRVANWAMAAQVVASGDFPPLVLAGGLKAENVAEAIRAVRPAAVDTASGVELSPGRKDPDKVARFVAAARKAFDNPTAPD